MKSRKLGSLEVSALGLGCMGMSEFYGPVDPRAAMRTLHRAVELGVTLFDTADAYGPFTNEELVGHALREVRERVVIATRFGTERLADGTFVGINGRPAYVRRACEGSLARLGVDHLDLYSQDRVDPEVPIEETVGAMAELVREGKVRFLGLTEAAPETIRRAHAVHPLAAVQAEYSLWTRDPEPEVLPLLRELGIGLVASSPLGRGFLAGRFRGVADLEEGDRRRENPRLSGANLVRNLELLHRLEALAAEKAVTPAQLVLAWVLARGEDVVPVPGTTRTVHLEEDLGALEVVLDADDLRRLDEAVPPGAAAGDRYPAREMGFLGR